MILGWHHPILNDTSDLIIYPLQDPSIYEIILALSRNEAYSGTLAAATHITRFLTSLPLALTPMTL